jgi:hypothetical protein
MTVILPLGSVGDNGSVDGRDKPGHDELGVPSVDKNASEPLEGSPVTAKYLTTLAEGELLLAICQSGLLPERAATVSSTSSIGAA